MAVVAGVFALLSTADSLLSLWERVQSGVNLGEILSAFRLASGPVALLLVILLLAQRPSRHGAGVRMPTEWSTLDQTGHWERVRRQAFDVESRLRAIAASGNVKVQDQSSIREAVDSLDFQVSGYSEMWQPGSYWDQRRRDRWAALKTTRAQPAWAEQLWDRVDYALWWLAQADPVRKVDDWGSWP